MTTTYEYDVQIPMVGFVTVTVNSDHELNDDEAFELALDQPEACEPWKGDGYWEFELMRRVVGGNVFYGPLNEVYVELTDQIDEED